jgi:alpha-1,2-mannosyltransferase
MVDQSLNGVIQRAFHLNPPADTVWLLTAVVAGAAGVAVAACASRRGHELLGVVLCGVTGLLVSPISWTHHWVWCVPALALVVTCRNRMLRAAGTALLLAVFFGWPDHAMKAGGRGRWFPEGFLRRAPHGQVGPNAWLEYTWRGATWLLGNSYVLAGLLALAGAAAYLWLTRGQRYEPAHDRGALAYHQYANAPR